MAFLFGAAQPAQPQASQPAAAAGVTIQTSCYGKCIPVVVGTAKLGPNLISYGEFTSIAHSSGGGGGGGGGKGGGGGGSSPSTTSYTYTATIGFCLCEGPIHGVGAIWQANNATATDAATLGYSVFTGAYGQSPWAHWQSWSTVEEAHTIPSKAPFTVTVDWPAGPFTDHGITSGTGEAFTAEPVGTVLTAGQYTVTAGTYSFAAIDAGRDITIAYTSGNQEPPSQALGYSGFAYIAAANYDLGSSAQLPNHNVEVEGMFSTSVTGCEDADPSLFLAALLTDPHWGLAPAFPASMVGDLSRWQAYCVACGLLISSAYTEQAQASQVAADLATYTNSDVAWTGGSLTVIPRGDSVITANGMTYTPPAFSFSLGDDDWLITNAATTASGGGNTDPLVLTRKRPKDAVNSVTLEILNRANSYNPEPITARDLGSIQTYGLNPSSSQQAHLFADAAIARLSAQLILQRAGILNNWAATVGEDHIGIDIGDLGFISNALQGLVNWPVRVTEITEQSDGSLLLEFEDCPAGIGSAPAHRFATPMVANQNVNATPGNANAPVLFEPPDALTTTGLEVWMGVSGGPLWGGCEVWASTDNATYARIGTISNPARTGLLTQVLPLGMPSDTVNTLSVDLSQSRGQLLSASAFDLQALNTLCWVGGELLAYQNATLTGVNVYALSVMVRGAYGTSIATHAVGAQFLRLDGAVFKLPFRADQIGQTAYFKLRSFNIWGGALQDLSVLQPITYVFQGSALASPLPNVTGLNIVYLAGIAQVVWNAVSDFRTVDYEIRQGASWASAQFVCRTPLLTAPTYGDGTYWIAAHFRVPNGPDVYSASPVDVLVVGSQLISNVIATCDEAATGWLGACVNAGVGANGITLGGAGDLMVVANILGLTDVIEYGGVGSSGSYTIPAAHVVNIGRVAACNVAVTVAAHGQSINDNVLGQTNVLAMTDMVGAALGTKISASPQIRLSPDGINWGSWQAWMPGTYSAMAYNFQVLLSSYDPQVIPVLTGFTFAVDVPDRVEDHQLAVPTNGMTVTYPGSSFNGSTAGQGQPPNPQITIVGAQSGDNAVLTNISLSGFQIQVINAGIGVARTINYLAQGY